MVANKYAFLQITRRRFLNEWEAFKKVISRRNIRRRITIPLTLSNLKLLRRITRTENILHRNFTRRQVAIQNRVASNIGISQSTFSVKVLNLFSRSRRKTNKRKSTLKWLETNNLFNNLIQRNQSAAFSSGKVRPNHETNINIIARRTGKDVNSHTVLDGIITTIMATIQRINIIGSREGSRNRRRLKANQTGKKFRVGIKSNISTNRNNLISGVDRCIHLNAMKKTTITSINRQTIKI